MYVCVFVFVCVCVCVSACISFGSISIRRSKWPSPYYGPFCAVLFTSRPINVGISASCIKWAYHARDCNLPDYTQARTHKHASIYTYVQAHTYTHRHTQIINAAAFISCFHSAILYNFSCTLHALTLYFVLHIFRRSLYLVICVHYHTFLLICIVWICLF